MPSISVYIVSKKFSSVSSMYSTPSAFNDDNLESILAALLIVNLYTEDEYVSSDNTLINTKFAVLLTN